MKLKTPGKREQVFCPGPHRGENSAGFAAALSRQFWDGNPAGTRKLIRLRQELDALHHCLEFLVEAAIYFTFWDIQGSYHLAW